VIVEEHVAELRRPRFERLRERAARKRAAASPRSVVPWPLTVEVEPRDIAVYAQAVGGAR
jgi:hypothetical protein